MGTVEKQRAHEKMGKKYKQAVPHATKQRNPKNKRTKSVLVFDEAAREDYLKGFSKRKKERQRIAQEKEEERLKEEHREAKRKRKEAFLSQFNQEPLAEIDDIVETKTLDLPEHTVSITDVSEVDFVGKSGLRLGANMDASVSSDEDDENDMNVSTDDGQSDAKKDNQTILPKKKFKNIGVKKEWKPKWERHTNYSHTMNHKNKRLANASKRRNEQKATKVKKRKPRNKPQ